MPAPELIHDLIARFDRNREAYRSGLYKESQLRQEFINPFFKALGWDVDNVQGYAEAYKDVIHEDAIKVGGATKAPDYCFRIGGTRKFFVEAKKPSVDIAGEVAPAYQLRRYAWSAKLPLSILTDFEEFAVYDTRVRPAPTDKASAARVLYLTCADYAARWDELAAIFSRDAILTGSFDRYAESTRGKKGTTEVNDAFLAEIESWRDELARHLALRNPNLTQRQLNYAVQATIDRIIFLRIAEDRGIEPYGRLMALLNGDRAYARLFELFQRADERYNSGLFHFTPERDRPAPPDTLTRSLAVDDKPLKDILRRLYYPESPYEFAVIPADILGQVYEQFLGKVIRLTAGHHAVVEEKPEVRKAGGVYYTPTYIVDYIVRHTLGPLLGEPLQSSSSSSSSNSGPNPSGTGVGAGPSACPPRIPGETPRQGGHGDPPLQQCPTGGPVLTPKQVSKLRILDPACGSGSFLLGAFQYLLDWHLRYYTTHGPEKWATSRHPAIFQTGPNRQSEIENRQSGWRLTTAERKRILLNNLYGVDIDPQAVEVTKLSLLLKVLEGESGETLQRQYELFHERALPDLSTNIKCGNSLIGPDFYNGQQMTLFDEEERYRINVFDWQTEFPEIMKAGGFDAVVGNPPYVRPHNLAPDTKEYYWRRYSAFVKKSDLYCCFIERAVSLLKEGGAFGFIVSNGFLRLDSFESLRRLLLDSVSLRRIVDFTGNVFSQATVKTAILLLTKETRPRHVVEVAASPVSEDLGSLRFKKIRQEAFSQTYKLIFDFSIDGDEAAIKQKMRANGRPLGERFELSFGLKTGDDSRFLTCTPRGKQHKPLLRGADVHRYATQFKGEYVWYVPEEMRRHRTTARPGTPDRFEQPKVLVRDTGEGLQGTFDGERFYVKDVVIISDACKDAKTLKALAGILNSRLMRFYYETSFPTLHVQRDELASLPIRGVDPATAADRSSLERLVGLVERMLLLHKEIAEVRTDHEMSVTRRQIGATDRQIDRLVYQLYGLTDAEVRIVEEANAR